MAGWFYPPPPQPPQSVPAPAGVVPFGNSPPNPIGDGQPFDAIRSTWPVEQWGTQTAGITASWLAQAVNSVAGYPSSTTPRLAAIRSTWPEPQWGAQSITGFGGASGTVVPSQVPYASTATLAVIRMSWPEPAWSAQSAPPLAVQFSFSPTLFLPASSQALQAQIRSIWPKEDWLAQSEPGVAAGLAQAQQPPLYVPFSPDDLNTLIRSAWPEPYWPAQFRTGQAAWIPTPITAVPSPVQHPEFKAWQPESWSAQSGTRLAAGFAAPLAGVPFTNYPLLASIRFSWPQEAWSAQTAVSGAAANSLFAPIPYDIRRQARPAYLWPQPDWPAQSASPQAFAFPVFVPPVPYFPEYAAPAALWPQPAWGAQTAPPFASASSGPGPRKKGPRVRAVTSGSYGGVYYQPGDVFDLNFADELSDATINYAGIGAGTQQFGWMLVVPSTTTLYSSEEQAGWIYPIIDPVPPKRFVY